MDMNLKMKKYKSGEMSSVSDTLMSKEKAFKPADTIFGY